MPLEAPIFRFGEAPPAAAPWSFDDETAQELLIALRRLRDSGAFRRLSPTQLPRVMELMPESKGVQEADEIFRRRLGMGVGEFLAQRFGSQSDGVVE